MNRVQLEEAILRATEVVGQNRVYVFGSQAILASFEFDALPRRTVLSAEADIAPINDIADHLSNQLWAEAGQGSEWANQRDFFIDAVSADTAVLPDGWEDRALKIDVPGHPGVVGICPDAVDLCASKLARNEMKDREFVSALIEAGLVDARLLRARFDRIIDVRLEPARARVARQFIIEREQAEHRAGSGQRRRSRGTAAGGPYQGRDRPEGPPLG